MPIEFSVEFKLNSLLRMKSLSQQAQLENLCERMVDYFSQWFRKLDGTRANKMGGERTHFYATIADQLFYRTESGTDAYIGSQGAQRGILQRFYGGPIVPTNGTKYLTIPATAEAYGHRARDFDNLELMFRWRNGSVRAVALVERAMQRLMPVSGGGYRRRKSGETSRSHVSGGRVFFWLVLSVNQAPDSSVLPSGEDLKREAAKAATEYLNSTMAKYGQG